MRHFSESGVSICYAELVVFRVVVAAAIVSILCSRTQEVAPSHELAWEAAIDAGWIHSQLY